MPYTGAGYNGIIFYNPKSHYRFAGKNGPVKVVKLAKPKST